MSVEAGYLEGLNDPQRQAVENTDGPVMVIAGAGSGKTRVLTYRIAHLLNQGADPFQILALTFTNKAAKEMKERIGKIIGGSEARNIWMGTFHSIFAKILRFEAEKINYPTNFTIYDTQDSKNLIKAIVKEMNLDDKMYKPGLVFGRISMAKNNLVGPAAYRKSPEIISDDEAAGRPKMADIYETYVKRCFKAGAMDFDDLLFKTNVLFRDFPDVLVKYQHKFKYLLVDEYQDTNFAQYLIVKKIAALHQNLCVVGDDAQSIYAFRGANIQNILNFKNDYPDYKLFKLEQNYRSTNVIVQAANGVIANNTDQIKKDVWTSNPEGEKIKVNRSLTEGEEAYFVASTITETQYKNQAEPKDFAILYRTNAQSRALEEALRKRNLPYRIYGGLSFYQRKEIKDLLAYLRLICNPADEESFKRVINYPIRGIGKTTIDKLMVAAGRNDASLWEVIKAPQTHGFEGNAGTLNKLQSFVAMIESFQVRLDALNAYEMAEEVAKSTGILSDLHKDKTPEGVSRYENVQELLNGISDFTQRYMKENADAVPYLPDFLIEVALLTDADQSDDEENNKIALMTIHSAKGLEFPYVHIVGLEENLFPSQMSLNSRSDLEEERRLFYVALTRAEKQLTLSYATSRFKWGNTVTAEPSRFLDEISEKFVDNPMLNQESLSGSSFSSNSGFSGFKKKEKPGLGNGAASVPKPNLVPRNLKKVSELKGAAAGAPDADGFAIQDDLQPGQQIEHPKFGKGKVLQMEGEGSNKKAVVFFPTQGQKQLLLRFAKLKVLA